MQAKNYAAQCAKDISAKNYIKLFDDKYKKAASEIADFLKPQFKGIL